MDRDGERSTPGCSDCSEALLEHRGFVRALARALVGGTEGEDVAQEALLAGLRAPPQRERAWRSWLRSTVRHLAANFRRTSVRREAREHAVAARERLPSTAALVQRLELEQGIVAAVLTLPEPERARLRRGLARLREKLDRDCGGRAAWMAGLGTTGVTVMSSKGIAALVAAGAIAATAWFARSELATGPRLESETPSAPIGAAAGAEADAPPPASGSSALPTPERAALAAEPAGGSGETAAAALPPPGEATFRVVSADKSRLLDAVGLTFLNEQRFAHYDGAGEGRVRLTSGRWSGRVTANGCEPREIADFEIAAGVATELGTIELTRGSGTIEGRVTARHVADREVTVELRGGGRGPCDECRETLDEATHGGTQKEVALPTKCCGFDFGASRLAVADGGRFSFGPLAAGVYWIRAFDAGAELVELKRVEIGRGGSAWVELDVSQRTSLAIELRHANGHHFTGDWKHPHHDTPANLRFDVTLGESLRGRVEAQPTAEEVRLTMGPPIAIDAGEAERAAALDAARASDVVERVSVAQLLELALTEQAAQVHERMAAERLVALEALGTYLEAGDRLDRAREERDALVAEEKPPELPRVALSIQQERPDRYRIGPLPRVPLTVRVECGRFASNDTPVDLRFGFEGALVVTLFPALEECHAALLEKSAQSCAACHDGAGGDASTAARFLELDVMRARVEELRQRASGR